MKKLILIIGVIIMCTGCWNYKELTELGIVTAMAISKKDNKYVIDMQFVNIVEAGDKGVPESPISVMSGEGDTIADAIRSINMKMSKVFFSSNMEYMIIDKSVADESLEEVMDFLARDTKLSLNFLIVTSTNEDPKNVLAALSQFNLNPASNVSELVRRSEGRYGASTSITFKEFLAKYLANGITPVIPNVKLVGEVLEAEDNETLKESNSNNYVEVDNLVAFDEKGEAIILGTDESFGYNFLNNHIQNGAVTSACGENYFTVQTLKSKIGFGELKGNKLSVDGEVQAEVFFYGCENDLNNEKTLDKLSKITKKTITEYIEKTINLAKEKKVDFVGIGNYLYKNENDYFDFDKKDWNTDGLSNIELDYNIEVTLLKQGNLKGDI